MRSRKLLALLFCLITFPAIAGYMTLLGAGVGSIAPVVSWVSTTDPTFPSSSLTYSGPSLSTMFDSTGKLTYAPNNLLVNSNGFTTNWTNTSVTVAGGVSDPIGGTGASTLTATAANAILYQSPTVQAGTKAISAIWIRRRTGTGTVQLIPPDNGAYVTLTLTGAWQQVSAATTVNAGGASFVGIKIFTSGDAVDVYAATTSAVTYETTPRTADQVITTSSAYYGPRIDYDPNTLAVKGLLIEEARTNAALQSNNFGSATWTKAGATVAQNVTGIDGVANSAWTLTNSAGAGNHWFYQAQSGTTGWTNSIIAKAGTANWLGIGFGGGASSDGAFFDLSTGVVGNTAVGLTGRIVNLGGGWYRCSVYTTYPAVFMSYEAHTANGQAVNYSAAGTETIVLMAAQNENATFPTSYIPTAAASVTRAADVVQLTGAAASVLPTSAGTLITEVGGVFFSASNLIIVGSVGSYATVVASGPKFGVSVFRNVGSSFETAANFVNGASNRFGVAWGASTYSMSGNGASVTTGSGTTAFSGTPYVGSYGSGFFINGWLRSFAIYNQRLPDATLQAKSVVGASYAANDNGLRFVDNDNLPIHWRVAL